MLNKEELSAKAYQLLSECEQDEVQSRLSEWERGFLNSNFDRKENGIPISSTKVIAILERILSNARNNRPTYRKSSDSYSRR